MEPLLNQTYVIFDLETTGLDPKIGNSIIEIGAVRMRDGIVLDRFDELIHPDVPVSQEITNITSITNEMLEGKPNEEEVVKKFLSWVKEDEILVAHNAAFDLSFLKMALFKYQLGNLNYDVLDTLGLSRYLEPNERYHNLTVLMERYEIEWEEDKHHRADYDSQGTGLILYEMLKRLDRRGIQSKEELFKIPKIFLNKRV